MQCGRTYITTFGQSVDLQSWSCFGEGGGCVRCLGSLHIQDQSWKKKKKKKKG